MVSVPHAQYTPLVASLTQSDQHSCLWTLNCWIGRNTLSAFQVQARFQIKEFPKTIGWKHNAYAQYAHTTVYMHQYLPKGCHLGEHPKYTKSNAYYGMSTSEIKHHHTRWQNYAKPPLTVNPITSRLWHWGLHGCQWIGVWWDKSVLRQDAPTILTTLQYTWQHCSIHDTSTIPKEDIQFMYIYIYIYVMYSVMLLWIIERLQTQSLSVASCDSLGCFY